MGTLYSPVDVKNALFLAEEKSLARFGGRGVHSPSFFSSNFSTDFPAFFFGVIFPEFFRTPMYHNLGDLKKGENFLRQRNPVGLKYIFFQVE